jgi:transcriptional regulator with XRE-family HTH domain
MAALRTARHRAGLTQVEAARLLGRPQSFVAKIENGERRVDVVELAEICRVYGRNVVSFVRSLEL